jgi:hypothetical protein
MKKQLIPFVTMACALACNSQAEGLYTYALIDAGIASTSITGSGTTGSKTEFVTGGYAPTFAGLTYEKAVDGGLTVGAKLEQGFLIAPVPGSNSRYWFGNGDLLNREANLYIKSAAGTFVVGTQPNIAFKTVLLGEPRAGSNFGSALAMIDIAGDLGTVDDAAISYTSPSLNGLTVAGQYVPQTKSAATAGGTDVKSGSRFSVAYSFGNLNMGLATYSSEILGQTNKASGTILSANYKMGDLTLKGLSVSQKTATTYASSAMTTTGIGGSYALSGKTTLDVGSYKSSSSAGGLSVNTVGAGAQYKLTKDLTLYGQYAKVDNKSTTGGAFINFAGPTVLTDNLSAGQSATTTNAGLLYAFF